MDGLNARVLFDRLRKLDLPIGDFAVFGSGPLAIRGLIDEVGDLDVITRGAAWEAVKDLGSVVMYGDDMTVDLENGLTFGRSWDFGAFDIDQLITEAEMIEGLPFVRLSAVYEYKRLADRPKDLGHIALMRANGLIERFAEGGSSSIRADQSIHPG